MGIDGHNFCIRHKPPIAFEMNLGDKACPQKGNSSFHRNSLKYEYLFWNSFGKRNSLWRTARMPLGRAKRQRKSQSAPVSNPVRCTRESIAVASASPGKVSAIGSHEIARPKRSAEYLSDRYLHCDVGSHNRKSACDRSQDSQKSFPCDS